MGVEGKGSEHIAPSVRTCRGSIRSTLSFDLEALDRRLSTGYRIPLCSDFLGLVYWTLALWLWEVNY